MNTTHGTRRLRNLSIVVSLGVVLLTGATGLTGSSSTAYAATSTSALDSASTSVADQVIATGLKYQGVRYEYGAESGDSSSFDCSSFTQFIFEQNGITLPVLPKTSLQLEHLCQEMSFSLAILYFSILRFTM